MSTYKCYGFKEPDPKKFDDKKVKLYFTDLEDFVFGTVGKESYMWSKDGICYDPVEGRTDEGREVFYDLVPLYHRWQQSLIKAQKDGKIIQIKRNDDVSFRDCDNTMDFLFNEYPHYVVSNYRIKPAPWQDIEENFPCLITPDDGKNFYVAKDRMAASHVYNPGKDCIDRIATDDEAEKYFDSINSKNNIKVL